MIFTTRMNAMMVVIFINFSSTNPDNDEYAAYHDIMIIVIVISVIFTLSFAFRTDRASTTPSRTQPAHRYSLMVIMVIMMVMIMMITWMIVIVTMIIIGTKPVRM